MEEYSIKKTYAGIGEIEYKIASSRKEIEQAMALVYGEYLMRGFILPEHYKSGLRVTLHHAVPGTATFIGMKNKEVVITGTVIPDSPLGLPMDMGYKQDVDKLRKAGRSICEAGYLAVKTRLFGRRFFSMFNFKKLDFMFTLFRLQFQYSLFFKEFDDICITTNPKYMIFKFLPFEIIGDVKYYGYDRVAIKKKAAVPKRLDLRKMRSEIEELKANRLFRISYKPVLHKVFLGQKLPLQIFEDKYELTPDDIRYLFIKKSDISKRLKKSEKDCINSWYGKDSL